MKMKKSKSGGSFASGALKMGSNQAALCAAAVLIAVLVNLILAKLPTTYTQFDLSDNGFFTLSQQSEEICENLEQDVTLYLIAENGAENSSVVSLLDRYKAAGSRIRVEQVDPVLYPAFTAQYTDAAVSDNSVIVVSGSRSKVVDYSSIFVTDYSSFYTTGQTSTSFDGEGTITSAIAYVTTDDLPIVYTLEGHGESPLSDTLQAMIAKDNYTLTGLSLMSDGGVPDDCSALLIVSPVTDLSEKELTSILTYMENGGSVILFFDYATGSKPNFDTLLENYGLRLVNGVVVERDGSHYFSSGYYHYLLPDLQQHETTSSLISGKQYVLVPQATVIEETESHRSTLNITPILTSTADSYAKFNAETASTMEKEEGDIDGPFNVGVVVTEAANGGEAKMICYSSSLMLDETVDALVSGGNTDLLLSTLGWTCGQEASMSIHAKTVDAEKLVVPAANANLWSVVLVIGLPLFFLLAGAIVVLDRRKK